MESCPCCRGPEKVRPLYDRPLRQLMPEDLHFYAFCAMTTMGDVEDFRHFLPRIFELLNDDDFLASVDRQVRENGNYEQAIVEFRKALEMDPKRPRAHFQLGTTYVQKGDLNAGIVELKTAVNLLQGNSRFLAYLGYADAAPGKRREAQEILSKLNTISQQQYVSPFGIATIYMGLGEKERALACLDKAYQVHDGELTGIATDHRLDVLHSDPRFQDLPRRVGLAR